MIDLHTHSRASDGSLEPAEVVGLADRVGLSAIALTDHDTVAGLDGFMRAGQAACVRTIPGVEVGASWYGGSLHLVGLFIDPETPALLDLLIRIREAREQRNLAVITKLNELGVDITYEEVQLQAGPAVVGRPHFAAVLVTKGTCGDGREAFDRYLGKGKPAYVRRYLPLPGEDIAVLHEAGGVVVWAHPLGGKSGVKPARLRQTGRALKRLGLDAVETLYSDYGADQEQVVSRIAHELELLPSGGSDFHGEALAGISLGTGYGALAVPDHFLPALEKRAATLRAGR